MGGAIYGNSPLKNAGQALLRGGTAGAASSGINYLSDSLDTRKIREDALRRMAQGTVSPYARRSDPSGLCSVPDPFAGGVGYPAVRGYRYEGHPAAGTAGKGGFNLADFGKELLTGFVAGGLSSAAFYGAGKAVEAVKGSVRSVWKHDTRVKHIYRAVSPEEYDDIFTVKGFRARPDGKSFQAKEFGNNFDETLDFANKPINLDKAAIIEVTIPEDIYNQLNHMNLDSSIFKSGTPVVEPEMLDTFNKSIISIEHVY